MESVQEALGDAMDGPATAEQLQLFLRDLRARWEARVLQESEARAAAAGPPPSWTISPDAAAGGPGAGAAGRRPGTRLNADEEEADRFLMKRCDARRPSHV